MSDLPPGYPRFKEKKPKKLPGISYKRQARMEERKEVILETHKRSGGRCQAAWIAPDVRCSGLIDCDEVVQRGRGGSAYDENNTQSLCRKCHETKSLEPKASEILGLYSEQGLKKHTPISDEDIVWAKEVFRKRKLGFHIP